MPEGFKEEQSQRIKELWAKRKADKAALAKDQEQ
jgi:hypothetical protein